MMFCTKIVIYFHLLPVIFSVTSLTSFQGYDLADFIKPYFKGNDFDPSTTKMSNYLIFTGPLNDFLLVTFIYFLILVFMPTAVLICIENTFWNIDGHGNFVELFKISFTLYVESGMREKTERDLEILRNEQNPSRDEFYKFIVNHYLRKFHCFYLKFYI